MVERASPESTIIWHGMMMLRIRHGLAADFLRDRFGILMDAVKYAVHATQILADAYVRPRLSWGWYRGPPLFRTLTRNRPRGGYWKFTIQRDSRSRCRPQLSRSTCAGSIRD